MHAREGRAANAQGRTGGHRGEDTIDAVWRGRRTATDRSGDAGGRRGGAPGGPAAGSDPGRPGRRARQAPERGSWPGRGTATDDRGPGGGASRHPRGGARSAGAGECGTGARHRARRCGGVPRGGRARRPRAGRTRRRDCRHARALRPVALPGAADRRRDDLRRPDQLRADPHGNALVGTRVAEGRSRVRAAVPSGPRGGVVRDRQRRVRGVLPVGSADHSRRAVRQAVRLRHPAFEQRP